MPTSSEASPSQTRVRKKKSNPEPPSADRAKVIQAPKAGIRKPRSKTAKKPNVEAIRQKLLRLALESVALAIATLSAIIGLLGVAAEHFAGTDFFRHLLPFATGVLALIVASALLLIGWWRLRKRLWRHREWLPSALAVGFALSAGWFVVDDQFAMSYGHFRTLVGGKEEAGRLTIAHQVYANYRRHRPADLQSLVGRAKIFRSAIQAAANAFDVDVNILQGLAAAESSFQPRDSRDGGHGLFQITAVPKSVIADALAHLETDKLTLYNHKHNAYIAAATFKHYLAEMHGDLFLALLAYNIGPANGGLRFIMNQYGATDFATIQPYLQTLPRDYPIRVLTYALAFKLWQTEGKLLAYEEDKNAARIQRIGIPGLADGY